MSAVVADTHALLWYLSGSARLSAQAVELVPRADVPDLPDRIIAATALHWNAPLVSRDRKIRVSKIQTIW